MPPQEVASRKKPIGYDPRDRLVAAAQQSRRFGEPRDMNQTPTFEDARVTELEFLAFLECTGPMVEMPGNAPERHGLRQRIFKDMVVALLCDGCVAGDEGVPTLSNTGTPVDPRTHLWRQNHQTTVRILEDRFPYFIRLTHDGRLRMARLRDELDRGRLYDQTGILLDGRHVERDLRVRLATAGEGAPVSILMGDLDHFKQVNDKLGHAVGDDALQRYFRILREVISAAGGDAYRKGGDETIAILSKMGSEQAVQVAESVREGVRAELAYLLGKGLKQPITMSLGVLTTSDREPPAELIKQVDRLLYQAKESRNRVIAAILP